MRYLQPILNKLSPNISIICTKIVSSEKNRIIKLYLTRSLFTYGGFSQHLFGNPVKSLSDQYLLKT